MPYAQCYIVHSAQCRIAQCKIYSALCTMQCIGLIPRHPDGERADQAEAGAGVRFYFFLLDVCSERGAHDALISA